jgi:hypothetical protein
VKEKREKQMVDQFNRRHSDPELDAVEWVGQRLLVMEKRRVDRPDFLLLQSIEATQTKREKASQF